MQVPKQYPLVIATAVGMVFQCQVFGMSNMGLRKQLFNKEFMQKHFGEEHKQELGQEIQGAGYPDTGNGPYSNKLSYRDWYQFNVRQRIHQNYVEGIAYAVVSCLAAGIYKPKLAIRFGLATIVGRFLYAFFYPRKGGAMNKWRELGALMSLFGSFANIVIFGVCLYQSYNKK